MPPNATGKRDRSPHTTTHAVSGSTIGTKRLTHPAGRHSFFARHNGTHSSSHRQHKGNQNHLTLHKLRKCQLTVTRHRHIIKWACPHYTRNTLTTKKVACMEGTSDGHTTHH